MHDDETGPSRRRFLKVFGFGLFAASSGRLLLPAPKAIIAPPAAPVGPWGRLEIYSGKPCGPDRQLTGMKLCSLSIPQPLVREGNRLTFPDCSGTVEASGTPQLARITEYLPDGGERIRDVPAGVSCWEREYQITFNSSLSSGGTVSILRPTIDARVR